jgi:hypothetical protein
VTDTDQWPPSAPDDVGPEPNAQTDGTLNDAHDREADWLASSMTAALADRAFWSLSVPALIWLVYVGRNQWFIRDDWAFILTRPKMADGIGVRAWLFQPQDGHWMTPPLIIYRVLQKVFGLGSYWPYLAVLLLTHIGCVLLVRALCRRFGASAWATTVVCLMLLVFGTGWENIVFAVQITYNLSLLGFLAQLWLTDRAHESARATGGIGRFDIAAALCGLVVVSSSGFGPFYVFGVALWLALLRRWVQLAVVVGPQSLALAWWWRTYGADPVGATGETERSLGQLRAFLRTAADVLLRGIGGTAFVTGLAGAVIIAVLFTRGRTWRQRAMVLTLFATMAITYAGIAWQRAGVDPAFAGSSRYAYMAAMVIGVVIALAVDQLGALRPILGRVALALLAVVVLRNAMWLQRNGDDWAALARDEKYALELLAGSPEQVALIDPGFRPLPFSPDVQLADLGILINRDAISPRLPSTPDEEGLVRFLLGLPDPALAVPPPVLIPGDPGYPGVPVVPTDDPLLQQPPTPLPVEPFPSQDLVPIIPPPTLPPTNP